MSFKSFKSKIKPQNLEKKKQKEKYNLKNLHALFDEGERAFDAFGGRIFSVKTKGTGSSDFEHLNLKIINS